MSKSDTDFKAIGVKRALPSLNGGFLGKTFTVPLKGRFLILYSPLRFEKQC